MNNSNTEYMAARPATPVTGCSWGLIYGMNEMTSLCNHRSNVEWGRDADTTDCVRVPFYANTVWLLTAVTGPAEKADIIQRLGK